MTPHECRLGCTDFGRRRHVMKPLPDRSQPTHRGNPHPAAARTSSRRKGNPEHRARASEYEAHGRDRWSGWLGRNASCGMLASDRAFGQCTLSPERVASTFPNGPHRSGTSPRPVLGSASFLRPTSREPRANERPCRPAKAARARQALHLMGGTETGALPIPATDS